MCWLCLEQSQLQLGHKPKQVFGCKPVRNDGSLVLVISCLFVRRHFRFLQQQEGSTVVRFRAPLGRIGAGFGDTVVSVTMTKRSTLLLLTALHTRRNMRRRHRNVTPEEAEETVIDSITLALE